MQSYFVDSFTREPFKGNPAGVCFPTKQLPDEQMLGIAAEFGFSETAFVLPADKPGAYTIRYFSPKQEIPLCGHATLAAAKVLFQSYSGSEINFITIHRLNLVIKKQGEGLVMEFPVYETAAATIPATMLTALGLADVVKTSFSPERNIILLEIPDADTLAALKPDFKALVASYQGINGVLVTAPSNSAEYDFHYRYFWPWAGTNEDPVTGGVQTFLAKYWSVKLGKTKMKSFQSSERTGYMDLELQGDKVLITGYAVIILAGNLTVFN